MAKIIDFENLRKKKQEKLLDEELRDKRISELSQLLDKIDEELEYEPSEELKKEQTLLTDELFTLLGEENESYYKSLSKKEELKLRGEVNDFIEGLMNYHE